MNLESINGTAADTGAGANIMERAVCLSVTLSRLGTTRKLSTQQIDVNADKSMLRLSKKILESAALDQLGKLDNEIRTYIARICLPAPMFRTGVYLIPNALVDEVDRRLERYRDKREDLIAEFMAEYQSAINDARGRLRDVYDPADYPAPDRVRAAFGMDTRYLTFGTPTQLKGELYQRELEKSRADIRQATEEIKTNLRAAFGEMIDHMVERLTPGADGKQKVFRDSLVGNVREFLDTFNARNITDDTELGALVDKARGLLNGASPDVLREGGTYRDRIRNGFADVNRQLDTMLVDRPRRQMDLDD